MKTITSESEAGDYTDLSTHFLLGTNTRSKVHAVTIVKVPLFFFSSSFMFYEAQLIQNFKFFQAENLVQCVPLRESIQIRSFTDVKLIKGSFDKEIMDIFK